MFFGFFQFWIFSILDSCFFGFWDLELFLFCYSIRMLHPKMSRNLTNKKEGFALHFFAVF